MVNAEGAHFLPFLSMQRNIRERDQLRALQTPFHGESSLESVAVSPNRYPVE